MSCGHANNFPPHRFADLFGDVIGNVVENGMVGDDSNGASAADVRSFIRGCSVIRLRQNVTHNGIFRDVSKLYCGIFVREGTCHYCSVFINKTSFIRSYIKIFYKLTSLEFGLALLYAS